MVGDLLVAIASSLGVVGTALAFHRSRQRSEARLVAHRLGKMEARLEGQPKRALLANVARRVETTALGGRLKTYAASVHPTIEFSDVLAWALVGIIGGLLVGEVLFGGGPLIVVGAVAGPVVVDRALLLARGRRVLRAEQQLPDALFLQASELRAGRSTIQSLRSIAEQIPPPLGAMTATCVRRVDVGVDLTDALEETAADSRSGDVEAWITAMLVHRQTGGNLASILDSLAESLREATHLRSEIKALTAQGRLSGLVVALAPVAFFVVLSAASPEHASVLFSTPLGFGILILAVVLELAGFLWIRRILKVRL